MWFLPYYTIADNSYVFWNVKSSRGVLANVKKSYFTGIIQKRYAILDFIKWESNIVCVTNKHSLASHINLRTVTMAVLFQCQINKNSIK